MTIPWPIHNRHSLQNRCRSIRREEDDLDKRAAVALRAVARPREIRRRHSNQSKARSKVACASRRPPASVILTKGGDFNRDTFVTSPAKIAHQQSAASTICAYGDRADRLKTPPARATDQSRREHRNRQRQISPVPCPKPSPRHAFASRGTSRAALPLSIACRSAAGSP